MEPSLPDRTPRRGGRWCDHRQMINRVVWRTRTGAPWRDVPSSYGNWKGVYSRHRRWSGDGTWELILDRLRTECDGEGSEWTLGDHSTVVRAHQHAAGARPQPPTDIPAERQPEGAAQPEGHTGGWVE